MWEWNSIENFLRKLNESEYLILRNYENLLEETFSGGDIDILCSNKEDVARQIHAILRSPESGGFNYYVVIGERKVPVDIREVGDGYYDEKWERQMLCNRIKTAQYYVMDYENYGYSLLYHAMIHKAVIAKKYVEMLGAVFGIKIGNNEQTDYLLCNYMHKNGYCFSVPKDRGVEFNVENYTRLGRVMTKLNIDV